MPILLDSLSPCLGRFVLHARGLCAAVGVAVLSAVAVASPLDEPIKPIPEVARQDPKKADLGRRLFNDVRLSANASVSCASCHDTGKGGADGRARSVGFSGQLTPVNAPTVLNAALNFKQFWNGSSDTLETQIDTVVQSPIEMGSRWADVIDKLRRDPTYRSDFQSLYPDGLSRVNIGNAIATYERTLVTPNSRFDQYLRGDAAALSSDEKAGYARFKQYGCVACHQGVNVGGNMFQKFGLMGDYFARRGQLAAADDGRFLVTHDEADRHVFKVPSLRNVALTAPYFHDGTAATLEDAVTVMFRYQLGRIPQKDDTAAIVKFLRTLTAPPLP